MWGLITVLEGRLRFRSLQPVAETVLTPGAAMAVAPQQPHEVAPDGPVRFFVEFYRAADPASSDSGPNLERGSEIVLRTITGSAVNIR